MAKKILVIGSQGQIGSELVPALRKIWGADNVIAAVHHKLPATSLEPTVQLDATDRAALSTLINQYQITEIYHLAGILSAAGEQNPELAWQVNMQSLKNVLDLAVEYKLVKVFWPSSIAAFGPKTPRQQTPQSTILEPTTLYGITKVAGELLCQYYFLKYGLDVRSLRYPGIISWQTPPGHGTTDYAVDIYYQAVERGAYDCFVSAETVLPMMYMDDAVRATIELMQAEPDKISIRTSYNLTALSFSAAELAESVKKILPAFTCTFTPDSRQAIADSWPQSIDDSQARQDWGWRPKYDLDKISQEMIDNLRIKLDKK